MNLGEYIKLKRKELNFTSRDLAKLSGVSQPYISQLETNKNDKPSHDVLKKLAVALKVEYHELLQKAGYVDAADFEEGNFLLSMVPEEVLESASDIFKILQMEETDLMLRKVVPRYKGHVLTEKDRERILLTLEALFPEYK